MDKVPINVNFAQGLDQKSDPRQIQVGKFYALNNSVFSKIGLLGKRNGFQAISTGVSSISSIASVSTLASTPSILTTFNQNLISIGNLIAGYVPGSNTSISKGPFQPISLFVQPVVRSGVSQTQCDAVQAANGNICVVYSESNNGTISYKYLVQTANGQNMLAQSAIPVGSGAVTGSPRVFLVNEQFIIVFTNVIAATSHLQFIAVSSVNASLLKSNTDIAASYISATTLSWDGTVVGSNLFVAYNTTSGGQSISITYINSQYTIAAAQTFASSIATIVSMTVDNSGATPTIYAAFWDSAGSTGNAVAVDQNLNKVMTATQWLGSGTVDNVTCTATGGVLSVFYENDNAYSYDGALKSNFISKNKITLPATVTTGALGTAAVVMRSVGLASKAFLMGTTSYMLATYSSVFQPTNFLIDGSGNTIGKLAYSNAGGYLSVGLPTAQVNGTAVTIAYLFRTLIQAVNKTQGAASATGVYAQTGVNFATFNFNSSALSTAEIGSSLNITGGYLYSYDGSQNTEQNFHLFPDSVETTWSATGGSIVAKPDSSTNTNAYYHQVIYQWTDAQGNIFNSAPSIPTATTTVGAGSSGSITLHGPMARITNKANVKIIIFRWSVAQQSYYQVTSITAPLLNDPTADSWTFVDTLADASIIGNSLIYTTGGILENTGGPACYAATLFDTRLWIVDAEDQNLLWYSKQVSEATPVEMTDVQTFYVAPNAGVSANTGPIKCIFPMDDKLIIFKAQSIYYVNGTGPGANGLGSQYSEPIFVTGTVGCSNQNSIVMTPDGLMFQSDKGIWLLNRGLGTSYIGAEVENSNSATVTSVFAIPETTQIRFTLNNRTAIVWDYFFKQWSTFLNLNAISSTVYNGLHTYLSSLGVISQETPGVYLDNGNPVLMSFTTGWLNAAGLRGYQRFYRGYFLGTYFSPHKILVSLAFDYEIGISQTILITPTNFSGTYGSDPIYGDSFAFGGQPMGEEWRFDPKKQKCDAFQLTFNEMYDPSLGAPAGAGFNLSGLNLIVGLKKAWAPIRATNQAG